MPKAQALAADDHRLEREDRQQAEQSEHRARMLAAFRRKGPGAFALRDYDPQMPTHPVLIAGEWRAAQSRRSFGSENPAVGEKLAERGTRSATGPTATPRSRPRRPRPPRCARRRRTGSRPSSTPTRHASRPASRELVDTAHAETGLPRGAAPRRGRAAATTNQLRQAAAAAREGSWALPTIDTKLNIRSLLAPIGPVWVFGPNNFPFAFNSAAAATSPRRSRRATR